MISEASAIMHRMRVIQGVRRRLRRRAMRAVVVPAHRFARCARGIAAVEFGFIAPIMLVLFLGVVEVTRAISIDRRFSLVASMVADLVAREERLSATDVTAIYDVVAQVMAPFDTAPLTISIIPVKQRGNEAVSYVSPAAVPSYNNAVQPNKCQTVSIEDGLLETGGAGDSVILVSATYNYTSLFGGAAAYNSNWQERAFSKPRKRNCVDFEGPNTCTSACR